jgi:2-hydroxychromene-2-carboxylate isomerase
VAQTVEFFYDYSSPWTYLAFSRIEDVCRRHRAELEWRPMLVGGIFNTVNPSVYESRERPVPAKAHYMAKDLRDWSDLYGLEIRFPPSVFPVNSVKSLRGALVALERGKISPYSHAVFAAYWGADRDISRDDVLGDVVRDVGLDPAEYFEKIASPAYKERIRANTDECIRRGGFGSPTIFVGDSMFFGNDRLVLVERELEKRGDSR